MSKCYLTTRLVDPANKSLKFKFKVVSCKVRRRKPRIVDKSPAIRKVELTKQMETILQRISTHEMAGCSDKKSTVRLVKQISKQQSPERRCSNRTTDKVKADTKPKRITALSGRPSHHCRLEVKQEDCTRGRNLNPGKTLPAPAVRKPSNAVRERRVGQCSAKRNWTPELPQTCPKQKSAERPRRPPIFYQKPAVIKDTGAAAASTTQPPGWPGFQVPKEYIHAREGVGNRIPGKQAEPVSAPASKPRRQATKRHVPQYSPKRPLDQTNLHPMQVPNESAFSKFFNDKVSLSQDDIERNSKIVNRFIPEILDAVRETDARKRHPEREIFALDVLHTGSYYEGLKVCRPDEFDVMVVLHAPRIERFFDVRCPPRPRDTLGHASVELKTWVEGGRRLWGEFLTSDGKFLSPRKVVRHFYSLVRESVAAMDKKQKQRISNLKEPKGPAVTFTIDGKIDVDLVLSLEISGWPSCAERWGVFATNRTWPTEEEVEKIKLKDRRFHLVAKPCAAEESKPTNSQKFWRISFSEVEKTLLSKASDEKKYFRIAKAIFEGKKDHLKPLTSFYLKTLFLDLRSENPRAINKENLGINVVKFFSSLIARLRRGQLPHYFVRDVDLLSRIKNPEKRLDLASKLEAIVKELIRDPRKILGELKL